ncbi:MAG: LemA family protein, partial [Clostridium sp.]
MWLIVIGVIVLLLISFVIGKYNKLVKVRNRVKNAWAQIDVQLQKRFDLVPNLLKTVKAAAKYESETLEKIVQ